MSSCYNEKTNTCNGSCQGCSDCPIARGLNPSIRIMKLYWKKVKEEKEIWDQILEEWKQDPEYLEAIEKMTRHVTIERVNRNE